MRVRPFVVVGTREEEREREGERGKRIEFINEINRYPLTTGMYELGKNLWEARVQKVEIFPSNIDFEGKK